MIKFDFIDLEILKLGENNGGKFNEVDIEESELKRLGVGRILDKLASLKDRKLIEMKEEGGFIVTELALQSVLKNNAPISIKILYILKTKPCVENELAKLLNEKPEIILEEIEKLRKNGLVVRSAILKDGKLQKTYELLPEGITEIEKIDVDAAHQIDFETTQDSDAIIMLEALENDIQQNEQLDPNAKETINNKINEIIQKLRD